MRRSSSRLRCASAGGSSRPSNSILPVPGGSSPATTRASVVLPEPDSPMTPIAWPRLSSRSMSSRIGHRRLAVAAARAVAGAEPLHAQQHLGACARRAGGARAPAAPRRAGSACIRSPARRAGARCADLAHAAVAQHEDVVGHLRDYRQVVADVDRRHLALAHDAAERAQHLDLRRHVERRGGLVEDHQLGVGDQRHRRHQPLQLAAGDLVRVALADGLGLRQAPARGTARSPSARLRRAAACRAGRPARRPGRGSSATGRTRPPRSARCRTRCVRAGRAAAARPATARPRRRCARCRR